MRKTSRKYETQNADEPFHNLIWKCCPKTTLSEKDYKKVIA